MILSLWPVLFVFGFQTDPIINESLRIEYVLVDLIALDRNNQPVSDLRATDLIVKDRGRKIQLESFQMLNFSGKALPSTFVPTDTLHQPSVQLRQQFIFCLDLDDLTLTQTKKTISQLRRAIKETKLPQNADYLLFSLNYGAQTPGFVPDRSTLLKHLALFEDRLDDIRARSFTNIDKGESILEIPDPRNRTRSKPIGVHKTGGVGERSSAVLPQNFATSEPDIVDLEEEKLRAKLGLLESLASKFDDTDNLKTIFFISPGFSLTPGKVAIQERKHRARKNFTRRTGANIPPAETMLNPSTYSFHQEFEKVIHTCTRNRVVFHAINVYLSALETEAVFVGKPEHITDRNDEAYFRKEYLRDNHKGLEQLATLSGGMLSRGADLQTTLENWLPRLQVVYLLGYTSPGSQSTKYRKIKIKSKRKSLKLFYRKGYFSAQ